MSTTHKSFYNLYLFLIYIYYIHFYLNYLSIFNFCIFFNYYILFFKIISRIVIKTRSIDDVVEIILKNELNFKFINFT